MQWSDVVKPPPATILRQFAVLFLVVFVGMALWRAWQGNVNAWTWGLGAAGLVVGSVGAIHPPAVRWLYTGWMVAAFPIGWTISRLMLLLLFYLLFTPVAWLFRLMGRDALALKRPTGARSGGSLWMAKPRPKQASDYFHQF
jgi:hypothetical protein